MCLHTLAVSSTGIPKRPLPTPQSPWPPRSAGSEGETGEKSTQSTVVAPEPASGGVWFLSEYAISVRKAKAVLPVHHCTAKLAALDPLLSVKTWWQNSIILYLWIICMLYCSYNLPKPGPNCSLLQKQNGAQSREKPWVVFTWLQARAVPPDSGVAWNGQQEWRLSVFPSATI